MNLSEKTEGEIYEEILERLLSHSALDGFDKRQSSVAYTMLAPIAAELAEVYIRMYGISENGYVDTADLDSLILKARELGLNHREASAAVILVHMDSDTVVPIGERFALGEQSYAVSSVPRENIYELTAETPGTGGNITSGSLLYLGYLSSIRSASIVGVKTEGKNAETAEELRARYYAYVQAAPFAGNKAAYREAIMAMPGVGGCRVDRPNEMDRDAPIPADCNVLITLISSSYGVMDADDLLAVENMLVGGEYGGGEGIAPICHKVFVRSVEAEPIRFEVMADYENGFDEVNIVPGLENAVKKVMRSVCEDWAKTGKGVLRKSAVFAEMLAAEGVRDIVNLTMKDSSGTACNSIVYDGIKIPALGAVIAE